MSQLPTPAVVGPLAAELLARLHADPDFPRLQSSTVKYADCWGTFSGYPIICEFDLATDSPPLFTEATRVLALKAAVFELTGGDEHAAELVIAAPVDEMIHAVIAQFTLCFEIRTRTGVPLIHMTDQERFGFDHEDGEGAYTVACYRAAGWGEPNDRYWIGHAETQRRLALLDTRYDSIGIREFGRAHDITFADPRETGARVAVG